MFKFSKEIIVLSSKYPLISGFYKLNTLCMKIAIRFGYFSVSELTLTLTNPYGRSTFTVLPGSPHSLQKNMNETSKKLNSFLNQSTRTTTAETQMETDGDDNGEDEEGNVFVEPDTITRTAAAAGDTSSSFNDNFANFRLLSCSSAVRRRSMAATCTSRYSCAYSRYSASWRGR